MGHRRRVPGLTRRHSWGRPTRRALRLTRTTQLSALLTCVLLFVFLLVGSQIFAVTDNMGLAVSVGLGCAGIVAGAGRWWATRPARQAAAACRRTHTSHPNSPPDMAVQADPTKTRPGTPRSVNPSRHPPTQSMVVPAPARSTAQVQVIRPPAAPPVGVPAPLAVPAPTAPLFIVDRAASKARAERLQTYLAEQVLTSRGEFICSSARSCKASLRRADSAFLEAQGHAVGPCYDLATVDGVPLRILIVPMEAGGNDPAYQHINVAQRTSHIEARGAQAFRARNPHMKGVTLALRLAFGLPVDDPNAEYLQFADGTTAQLFSCFAMTNLLLCSAVATGTMHSRATAVMRANCAQHLVETVKILRPTLVISQGEKLDKTLRESLGVTATMSPNLADCTLQGNGFTWVSLHHPTRNWEALSRPYLREVVIPTINQARAQVMAGAETATRQAPPTPGPQINRDGAVQSKVPTSRANHGERQAGPTAPQTRVEDDQAPCPREDAPIMGYVDGDDPASSTGERAIHVSLTTTLGCAGDDNQRERRLTALLQQALGIDRMRPVTREEIGAEVMLDAAIGTTSTQRLCLRQHGDALILRTWLAEKKTQAVALYRTGKAQRLLRLLSEGRAVWYARPNVHLAFRNAAAPLRLYPHCHLDIAEYVRRWSADDFAWVGQHPRDELRSSLWPWLRDRQYAGPEDDEQIDGFLDRLGNRPIFLRPSLEVTRIWPWAEAVELDERGAMTGDIRLAVTELLSALNEPLPPACVVNRENG